ncbi:uncharacterized protein BJ212DRAFT_347280 [Suillus subaureus]|uniref:Uncharacterized protein n=1 Tax=Suillus subaureus TaxID=48587 RepID=A0A9P7E8Z6_9AGAM|nr:uncharacterized protein BJ212DRAFT_347280 [Suillus subaureus]KAG1814691.1 hypothetical protein BJ212DRAFT_347280 [Suillus subaureus]
MNRRHVLNFTIMMTLLPCAILLSVPFVCASLPSLNDTSTHALDASNCPSCNTRTLWDILLSCGLTLFACTWTAIHPNIPGMDEGKVAITSRRLFIMVIALIAPELMITWATRQFFSARDVAKDFNASAHQEFIILPYATYDDDRTISTTQSFIPRETSEDFNDAFSAQSATTHGDDRDISKSPATLVSDVSEASRSSGVPRYAEFKRWTITHGFFAWMGGFMLYVNGEPRATLTPDKLLKLVCKGFVDFPAITKAEIEDRSKGDGLSKGIAVLQLVWFVAQLVARYIQSLPITLLEIDTLAVAALTCISYALWWKKPKDVGCPYVVHLKAATALPGQLAYGDFLDDDSSTIDISRPSESYYRRIRRRIAYPFLCLMGIMATPSHRAIRSRRVPSLGGYRDGFGHYSGSRGLLTRYRDGEIILLIGCFGGVVFGGIHCLGWNYFFHSHAEHILWRATSLVLICVPVFFLLNTLAFMHRGKFWLVIFGFSSAQIVSLIYIMARVTLIVLILLSLQSPPTGIYDTVAWTGFIPHL